MALISTEALAARIAANASSLRILDARWYLDPSRKGLTEYEAGHIPGALFADIEVDFAAPGGFRGGPIGRHPFPGADQITRVGRAFGIAPGITVVAYDDASGAIAARVWFVLRAYGFDDCLVLDGGIVKWIAEGRELSTAPPSISTLTDFEAKLRPGLVLSKQELVARQEDKPLVLDARAQERYLGDVEPIDPRAGHIPGALNAPFSKNLFTAESGPAVQVFRPPSELRKHYESLGVSETNEPVVYCGSGITASHDLLALNVAGFGGRLYGGSWSEWSSDPSLPVAKGYEPGSTRD